MLSHGINPVGFRSNGSQRISLLLATTRVYPRIGVLLARQLCGFFASFLALEGLAGALVDVL